MIIIVRFQELRIIPLWQLIVQKRKKVIGVSIEFNKQYSIKGAEMQFIRKRNGISESLVKEAIEDGCSRLAFPSIERQIRNELSEGLI